MRALRRNQLVECKASRRDGGCDTNAFVLVGTVDDNVEQDETY